MDSVTLNLAENAVSACVTYKAATTLSLEMGDINLVKELLTSAEKTSIGLNAALMKKFFEEDLERFFVHKSHQIYGNDKNFTAYGLCAHGNGSNMYICNFTEDSDLESIHKVQNVLDLTPGVAVSYVYTAGSTDALFHLYLRVDEKWYFLSKETENGHLKNQREHPGYFLQECTDERLHILEYNVTQVGKEAELV